MIMCLYLLIKSKSDIFAQDGRKKNKPAEEGGDWLQLFLNGEEQDSNVDQLVINWWCADSVFGNLAVP